MEKCNSVLSKSLRDHAWTNRHLLHSISERFLSSWDMFTLNADKGGGFCIVSSADLVSIHKETLASKWYQESELTSSELVSHFSDVLVPNYKLLCRDVLKVDPSVSLIDLYYSLQ